MFLILRNDTAGFNETRRMLNLRFICGGLVFIYFTQTVRNSRLKKIMNIGYVPFVLGYTVFAADYERKMTAPERTVKPLLSRV